MRASVAERVGSLGGQDGETILSEMIEIETDPIVRAGIAAGAVRLENLFGKDLLDILMRDPSPQVRRQIVLEVVRIEIISGQIILTVSPSAVERLRGLMRDSNPQVRASVAERANFLERTEAARLVSEMISVETEEEEVIKSALSRLAYLGGQEAESILNQMVLRSDSRWLKQIMKTAVQLGGDIEKRIIFKVLMNDSNPDIRKKASSAMEKLQLSESSKKNHRKKYKSDKNEKQLKLNSCETVF